MIRFMKSWNTIKDTQSNIRDFANSIPSNEQETIPMLITQELFITFFYYKFAANKICHDKTVIYTTV